MSIQEYRLERKEYLKKIREFAHSQPYSLATTRFTNETWEENQRFREKNPNAKCAYSTICPISSSVPVDGVVFVLEMNNDTNQIMGIGLIRNRPIYGKYSVYSNEKYNRFSYLGKRRIDCNDMTSAEKEMMKLYEAVCFNGKSHLKRGHGITKFPIEIVFMCLQHVNLIQYVKEMFKQRMDA
jgi:hypothetical protein